VPTQPTGLYRGHAQQLIGGSDKSVKWPPGPDEHPILDPPLRNSIRSLCYRQWSAKPTKRL